MVFQVSGKSIDIDHILGHWLWATPILLAVAIIATRESGYYAPSGDEYIAMTNVGWVIDGPYSPVDVLEALAARSPEQAPLYYLLLNLWGNFVPQEIELARVLSVFFGLLYLAICFRTARDFVAPVCGPIALTIVASNGFMNLAIPYARMYQLFLLTAAIALWLYLRILYRRHNPKPVDYFGLFLACLALGATHVMSAIAFVAVGAFHILFAPKGHVWLRVSLCAVFALLLNAPWMLLVAAPSIPVFLTVGAHRSIDTLGILTAWMELLSNGSPILLLIPAAGLAVAWRQRRPALQKPHLLVLFYFIAAVCIEQTLGILSVERFKYLLPGFHLLLLAQAAGYYALVRIRPAFGLFALIYVIAGVSLYAPGSGNAEDWKTAQIDVARRSSLPPIHQLGRYAVRAGSGADIYAYRTNSHNLQKGWRGADPPIGFYFDFDRVKFRSVATLDEFRDALSWRALTAPSVWLYYQTSTIDAPEADALADTLNGFHYTRCRESEFALDTILLEFWWSSLSCKEPQAIVSASSALIEYQFHGSRAVGVAALAFSDEWKAKPQASTEHLNMSYQLLSENWGKVAQLDLPLVHEGMPRQFTIGLSDVNAGHYRLIAILYDRRTGERFAWATGADDVIETLALAQIEL